MIGEMAMARTPNSYGRYIAKRGQRFFAVMKVPKDLQRQLARTRYLKALGTDSPAEARRTAPLLAAAWQSAIAGARQSGTNHLQTGRAACRERACRCV